MKTISLAIKRPDYSQMTSAAPESPDEDDLPKKDVFPSLYIDGLQEKIELPDSGEATISFRTVERRETTRDDKTTCSYDLEILSITPSSNTKSSDTESGDEEIEAGLSKAEKDTSKS